MSPGRRTYDLLRGYVNREWDRINHIEQSEAELELRRAMDEPAPFVSPKRMPQPTPMDTEDTARRILGVAPTAQFVEIRHAFVRLTKRSDPDRFPAESTERVQAAEIRMRVQWAYLSLTADVDPTERRFGSLEID